VGGLFPDVEVFFVVRTSGSDIPGLLVNYKEKYKPSPAKALK
jgi:hypothetical protein